MAQCHFDPMSYDRLTIGQTMQHTSKEVLGALTDIFELIISGPFSSLLDLFRFDSEDVVAIAVTNGYVNMTSGRKFCY
jgi:hypothetical protein